MNQNIVKEIPVAAELPERIARLNELAYNIWWAWNADAIALFKGLNVNLWEKVSHNPVAMLKEIPAAVLKRAASDEEYTTSYDAVMARFDAYMGREDTWFRTHYPQHTDKSIAYVSFEFGLHESIPAYAGGLGILAGDHLKEASDMGLPLSGIGFIYNQGYFKQKITEDGWQETSNFYLDFHRMPIIPLRYSDGRDVKISVDLPGRKLYARIWMIQVGRIPLYLMDTTSVNENSPYDQQLTSQLYTSDLETRIAQEILLGIGGVRVMRTLGIDPSVWHMNEGHAAFLALERCYEYMKEGKSFEEAAEIVKKGNVFTTHTPVPAGNDRFPIWLLQKYFDLPTDVKIDMGVLVDLAREDYAWGEQFTMPILALRLSNHSNGVSKLHGEVSRKMWQFVWPERNAEDVPIDYVTNGVHSFSWLSHRMGSLFDKYLPADWRDRTDDFEMWKGVENIPNEELWAVRRHQKRVLNKYIAQTARATWVTGTVHPVQTIASGVLLEPDMLTIGFARRFATYKRGSLILRDWDRLIRLLNNVDAPLQFIFAGKAHPADEPGKMVLQQIYRAVKDHRTGGRMVFLENYDMNIARHVVQGVDVWMNTPRRPLEASGTSGMKAAMNGALNFSVLDGWWAEGYNGLNGWAIGTEQEYESNEAQDAADALSLYETLENQIIPTYYDRRDHAHPSEKWMVMMKNAIETLSPMYSTRRMVGEYVDRFYIPSIEDQQ